MRQQIKFYATLGDIGSIFSHRLSLLTSFLFLMGTASWAQDRVDSSQTVQKSWTLELGKPIERELAGGKAHAYQINPTAGQYLHVVVEQRGIDVVVRLFAPDGKQLAEVDSPSGAQGPEPVSIVTEVSGAYRLEVRSLDSGAPPGRYEVKVEELRKAQPLDKNRIAAERVAAEAVLLTVQGTAESMHGAVEKYGEALKLWQSLGDSDKVAFAFNSIGGIYYYLGENQKALENFTATLMLRRALGDRRGEAEALNNLGTVYDSFGDKRKALDYYQQSLPYWQAINDRRSEATLLNNIGVAYSSLGENPKALEYCSKALLLAREVGDRLGEAQVLVAIGRISYELGDRQKAFDCDNQALLIAREINDRVDEAATLNHLGLLYSNLGERQKALEYYDQSLQLARVLGDRFHEAVTLSNMGVSYRELGEGQKALDYYEQALALRRAVGDRDGEAITLNNIGVAYDGMGEKQKALEYYERALPLLRAVGNRRIEAQTLSNIADAYDKSDEVEKALDHYHRALAIGRTVSDPAIEAIILFGISRAERHRGNLVEACTQIESALREIESLRTRVSSQQLRASYFASKQHFYEFYLELLMQMHQLNPSEGHDVAALQASERARARTLLEILGEARVNIRQGVDSTLVERERTLQQLLNSKAERFTKLLSGKHTKEDSASAERELNALLTEYQEIQASIRATSPRYAALTQPQPMSMKDIQQHVLDDDTILLEYALGEELSFLWAVTPATITSFVLPKRAEIDSLARRVYELLTARNQRLVNETPKQRQARLTQAVADYQKTGAALSQIILAPVASQLGIKRLLIVTEGALQYIPFGALPAPLAAGYKPLALDHEIVSLPSASVLAVLRKELEGRNPPAKSVAVLADPVFANDDSRVKRGKMIAEKKTPGEQYASLENGRLRDGELERAFRDVEWADTTGLHIPRLPFSRQEAEGIILKLPANESMKALDFAASRATATSAELGQYRIVHFATHGLLNSEHPELSGIVLSLVNEHGEPQDGFLRLHEIYNLNLPADLVVLSACQTALGKEIKGEGLIGLTRGFMYAGAARVVASLWKVDDEATAELMKRFYQKMFGPEKLRPAAALRAAQVSMWQEKRWQPPYYWAAFVLQGEWK